MGFLIELIADLLLLVGFYLVQWCIRHKSITLTIAVLAAMAIDVYVMIKIF